MFCIIFYLFLLLFDIQFKIDLNLNEVACAFVIIWVKSTTPWPVTTVRNQLYSISWFSLDAQNTIKKKYIFNINPQSSWTQLKYILPNPPQAIANTTINNIHHYENNSDLYDYIILIYCQSTLRVPLVS